MSTLRSLTAGIILAATVVVTTAGPAFAHDQLIDSTPTPGQEVTLASTEVTLTYSADLLTLGDEMTGTTVAVLDSDGTDWVAGAPVVVGSIVTAPVKPNMPSGAYEIHWTAVSADGHKIPDDAQREASIIRFTVAGETDAPTEATPTPSAAATAEAPADAEPDAQESSPVAEPSAEPSILALFGLGLGGAAIVIFAYVVFRAVRRGRNAR